MAPFLTGPEMAFMQKVLADSNIIISVTIYKNNHYCPVKILDLEINRVDHHPLGR